MKWRSSTSRLVLTAVLLVGSVEASAQTPTTNAATAPAGTEGLGFAERYQRAMTHYKADRFRESIVEFQAAYALQNDPKLLINIGRAYFKLGQMDEAIAHYERFLREDPSHDSIITARVKAYRDEAQSQRQAPTPAPTPSVTSATPSPSLGAKPPETASPPPTPSPPPTAQAPAGPALSDGNKPAATPPPEARQADAKASPPIYKRWWLWTIVGVVVAGGATTAAVLATRSQTDDLNGLDVRKLQFGLSF